MSRIQGKQIENKTIGQEHLILTTPTSGETTSGATVGYVNSYINSISGSTVIGPAEDGSYTDGIFTDFNENTRIGVAIDRFNEVLLKLAPTPPSDNWTSAFSVTNPSLSTSTITARMIGTGASTSSIVVSTTTPSFTLPNTISTSDNSRSKDGNYVFTLYDYDGSVIETTTINSGSTSKTTGLIRYTIADPYNGISGQQGFWTGVTAFSASGLVTSNITPSTTARNIYFSHPSGQYRTGTTFYVDITTANTPSVTNLIMGTLPTMTRFISGVPSLPTSAILPITSFDILSACTYFYAPSPIWTISNVAGITAMNGDITNTLTTTYDTGLVGNQNVTISNSYTESIGFTIQARNRSNVLAGNTTGVTYNNLRYDPSNESSRLTSGSGNYPSNGWGGTWGTNSGVSLLTLTDELQMLNGRYVYPTNDYTIYGGPNYSTATGTRWVTFNLGTFNNNVAFTLNINGAIGITSVGQANLFIEVKISGATSWVNGDAYWGGGNPGSGVDGDAAVDASYAGSSATVRRITFGSITRSGAIIVRIGYTGSGPSFTNLTATNII